MVSYAELGQEAVWNAQFVPHNLNALREKLESFYDPHVTNIGVFGDNRHLKGYHRSRNWILHSRHATNRTYSVVETQGNRLGGSGDWVSAVDIVVGYDRSLGIWERVNGARRRGQISYVRQALLERDPWHVHLSLDRGHANDNHDTLYHIIMGDASGGTKLVDLDLKLPMLRNGAEGRDVITVQALLGARGFETKVDGEFGPDTHMKTVAMQQHYGAESVDGIWGPETWTIGITGEDKL